MRVLVCGSRDWDDLFAVERFLEGLAHYDDGAGNPFTVIEGGAQGADRHAYIAARDFGYEHERFPAEWDKHGKGAGPIRNQQMLDEGKPDLVLAFVNKPLGESRGTADMVRRARAANVPTYIISAPITDTEGETP